MLKTAEMLKNLLLKVKIQISHVGYLVLILIVSQDYIYRHNFLYLQYASGGGTLMKKNI